MLLATVVLWALNITVTKYVLTHGFQPLAYATRPLRRRRRDLPRDRPRRRAHAARRRAATSRSSASPRCSVWLNQVCVRLRPRAHDRVDGGAAPRRDADLRRADRPRARARAAVAPLLARRGRLVRRRRARRGRLGRRASRPTCGRPARRRDRRHLGRLLGRDRAADARATRRPGSARSCSALAWVGIAASRRAADRDAGLLARLGDLGAARLRDRSGRSCSRTSSGSARSTGSAPSRATLVANLQPFLAAVFALVLLDEQMTLDPGRRRRADRRRDPARAQTGARTRVASNIRACPSTTSCPSRAGITSSSGSGTRSRPRSSTSTRSASRASPTRGPETGVRDRASYVLEQGEIRLVLTSGLAPRQRDHALRVRARRRREGHRARASPTRGDAYREAVAARRARRRRAALGRGRARPRRARHDRDLRRERPHVRQPRRLRRPVPARLRLAPAERPRSEGVGLRAIDHVVGNVELGRMNHWVEFYERVFGMTNIIHFGDEQIQTEYSALMSKVMADGEREDQVPDQRAGRGQAQEPDRGVPRVQRRPGRAAHRAPVGGHRRARSRRCRSAAFRFLDTPETYYEDVEDRVGEIDEDYADLQRLRILADRDEDGYLLQIFTKTAQDRPTLFFEVIERHGATTLRRGQLQGALRVDRARAGAPRL